MAFQLRQHNIFNRDSLMITRIYAHNFRCFQNFELRLNQKKSVLLVGPNGAGKSTLMHVLQIFQQIGRGINACDVLLKERDFAFHTSSNVMHFELECDLNGTRFLYQLQFELPSNFKRIRVHTEMLEADNVTVFSRSLASVNLIRRLNGDPVQFQIDWHLVALPLIQEEQKAGPLSVFKNWLESLLLIAPVPSVMTGIATVSSTGLDRNGNSFSSWLLALLQRYPAAYVDMYQVLKSRMPDLSDFRFEDAGRENKMLTVRFRKGNTAFSPDFDALSDGEKMFFLEAAIIAASRQAALPVLCFWDEPDHYIAPNEVAGLVSEMRKSAGQSIISSHSRETIEVYPNEDVFILHRNHHLLPTQMQQLSDADENVFSALVRGEFAEPEF
jgi:ABC-type uncharacterized transport system ATPase subunit